MNEDSTSFDFSEEGEDQHQPDPSTDFHPGHITRDTFQALLTCYPATLEAVTRRKAIDRVLKTVSKRGKQAKRLNQAPPSQVVTPELDEGQKKQVEAEVEAFRELDALRYEELPGVAAEKRALEKEEVVKLVEWKLKHGIFRPTLLGMVKANQAKTVQKATSDAFTAVNPTTPAEGEAGAETGDKPETDPTASFPKPSLDALMKPLRGVGIATASLLLSVGTIRDPEHEAPFYSDDTYLWLCMKEFPCPGTRLGQESEKTEINKLGKKASQFRRPNGEINVKYDVSEYRTLWTAVNELRARLNESETPSGKVSCADIEKVAFVLRHIDVSGYLEEYDVVDHDLQPADEGIHEAKANPGIKRKRLDKEDLKKGGRNSKKKTT